MYYISKQTYERRDHFHRQCNEVQHIVQLELDRAKAILEVFGSGIGEIEKKVNRDWKFI